MEDKVSLRGNIWIEKKSKLEDINAIQARYGLTEPISRIIVNREVQEDAVESFLHPTLGKDLPDPFTIKYTDKAAARIADAIQAGEKIAVFGDYDVDGATSAAVLSSFLKEVGTPHEVRIPDRDDGYGAEPKDVDDAIAQGCTLFITVDCGTTAFAALEHAKDKGMDAIVVDHHEPGAVLPHCLAIVNPKLHENGMDNPCRIMAAVGVVFMLVIAISRELRTRGFYASRPEPDLKKLLDLVAFGTVCDAVPLKGVNRLFVKAGLFYAERRTNKGLAVLAEVAGIKAEIGCYHLGFVLGPRINAGGRIGGADLGYRLLTSTSREEALDIAMKLDGLNIRRREIESEVLYQSIEQVEKEPLDGNVIIVKGKGWHQGVIGIVAGRLKERYNLPSLVLSIDGDTAKGSARSVHGFDLGNVIIESVAKGLLLHGGGHMMAAGFTLSVDKIPEFRKELEKSYITTMAAEKRHNEMNIDMYTTIAGINSLEFLRELEKLEPFGEGNPEVVFAIRDVIASNITIVGNGNIKCRLRGMTDGHITAIMFRAADTEIGRFLLANRGEPFSVAGRASINRYRGMETPQLIITDIMT